MSSFALLLPSLVLLLGLSLLQALCFFLLQCNRVLIRRWELQAPMLSTAVPVHMVGDGSCLTVGARPVVHVTVAGVMYVLPVQVHDLLCMWVAKLCPVVLQQLINCSCLPASARMIKSHAFLAQCNMHMTMCASRVVPSDSPDGQAAILH